ncbi:MAG TPA: phosphate ABC transporter, permease protein PstA, partial [Gammaproteobacteria bacterium]
MSKGNFKNWWKSGAPWVWLNAGAVTLSMIAVIGLLALIAVRGLAHFWAPDVYEFRYRETAEQVVTLYGSIRDSEPVTTARLRQAGMQLDVESEFVDRHLIKMGNRDQLGSDFRFIIAPRVLERSKPVNIAMVERTEWGDQT